MRNPRKEIVLQNTANGLLAHFLSCGKPDAETVRLFGTHILPTAYTARMEMVDAVREIKKLNPGYAVSSI